MAAGRILPSCCIPAHLAREARFACNSPSHSAGDHPSSPASMQFINRLESIFGRFAIPGLVQILAVLQLGVFCMTQFLRGEALASYTDLLMLDTARVMKGEVWRLATFLVLPTESRPFWALISALFMLFCGRAVESHWGAFRLNLYVLFWVVLAVVANHFVGLPALTFLLNQSIFFAFATLFPDQEIQLYGILPVKAKWIAWIYGAKMFFDSFQSPILMLFYIYGHLNFLVTFAPAFYRQLKHSSQVGERRARYQAASRPPADFFHQCSVCKKTELDDPQLDFRVLASGEEICSVCRAKQSAGTP